MNPIVFALRHPYAVLVGVAAVLVGSLLAMSRAKVDVFPNLNQPVIYICQPYGGMTPQQMEALLTSYYEYHFLYVNGVHHVESKNIQGMTLLKVYFHPGTDMAQALAETVAAVNRSRFMMPPGTVPPFVSRLDVGSASVGYLVLSSDKLAIKDVQDISMLKVRPMFASIPGISTPPAFGGNQRAIVVSIDPDKLRAQQLTLDQVTDAVAQGNTITPSGNVRVGDRMFLVTTNTLVGANPQEELKRVPVKLGEQPVFLRDVATISDATDITAGYVLVNGRRSVYMLVTKRSDASTVTVVNELNKALPRMRDAAPEIDIAFAFDQSPIVTNAMWGVASEGALGAVLTGLMVLLFLRDWRSVLVVVLNIPLALLASILALWVAGQTINLMSLGGLALAVGILVDEATVEVENIHAQMERSDSLARAVRRGNSETAVPRLLAMLCVLAVFLPSFFMQGAARELFVPLSLAVGFAMVASYVLSSTFVPVMCVWLLRRPAAAHVTQARRRTPFARFAAAYEAAVGRLLAARWAVAGGYLAAAVVLLALMAGVVGTRVFPPIDAGQFQLRMKAPTGTRVERTEELAQHALRLIEREAGAGNVKMSVGYVGMIPSSYPIQAVYQWTGGPEEVILKVALAPGAGIRTADFKDQLRAKLPDQLREWLKDHWIADGVPDHELDARAAGLRLSFEPGDLVSEVMSFGAPTPVEVQVSGSKPADNLAFANRLMERFRGIPELQDVQIAQTLDYPAVDVTIDREKAATMGLTARAVGGALVPATASSRFMSPIYWRDPGSGQGYIVQVQVPPPRMSSATEIGLIPVRGPGNGSAGWAATGGANGYGHPTGISGAAAAGTVLLRDVASVRETTIPGEVDRYNMRRMVSVTANVGTADLGRAGRLVRRAIDDEKRATIEAFHAAKDREFMKAGRLTANEVAMLPPEEVARVAGLPAERRDELLREREKNRAELAASLKALKLPGGMTADARGQVETLDTVMGNLAVGLGVAVLAIFLLLTAYFQSVRLALVSVAAVPGTLCGVGAALVLTGTTLNLQSFMGAIMSVGVAVANAILLVTFAERSRLMHGFAARAAAEGGAARLRAILMTSCAMAAGMVPMALGFGDGGDQTAPLGRAVLGGVVASTFTTLLVLPAFFAVFQNRVATAAASLDPDDPASPRYDANPADEIPE